MYYQNNYNPNNQQCETPGFVTPPTLNINGNNEFGNIYFPIPPPPLLPFHHQQVTSPVTENVLYKNEGYTNQLQSHKQGPITPASGMQPPRSLPSLNLISRKKKSEYKCDRLPFSDLNVTSVKKDFMKCTIMLKEFERLINLLKVFKRTLSNEDWSIRCEEVKSKEEEITKLLDKYETPEYFLAVQRVVKRCLKKRVYRKRKKKEWQEMKKISNTFREREHRRIDMWLEKMRDQVERAQRQEQVKREADLVLSEVTSKKTEAKRFINLLNTLTKLRNARVQQLTSTSSFVSECESKSFTQVIDKLKKLWIDQLKEYNVEEKGLQVMLNDAEVERVNVETKVNRQIQKKWNEALFGESITKPSFFANNLDELIDIRHEWDRFINADNTRLSSRIPVGWIVPSEPSNSDWSRFLHQK